MPRVTRYSRLPTEQRNPRSRALDRLPVRQLLTLMHHEDRRAVDAVRAQLPRIAEAVSRVVRTLRQGGRLVFVGAGTSGRLGVIEAAECPPTFHTAPSLVQAVIAGGRRAVFRSQEGAEDDRVSARRALTRRLRSRDVVVGIAASGVTPFVEESLTTARALGADTILITCNPRTTTAAALHITLAVGPEVLTGSTRLKAGTATKLVLNMLTLAAMVQLGKTYGNLMVDVRPTSRKLRARAVRIIQSLAHCSEPAAGRWLRAARGQTKAAVVMATARLSYAAARRRLAAVRGSLRLALGDGRP